MTSVAMLLRGLTIEEHGQDLTEYSLLLVFILLAIIGVASGYHNAISGVAGATNANLAAADAQAH